MVDNLRKQNINIIISQTITATPSIPIPPPPLIDETPEEPEPFERPEGEVDPEEENVALLNDDLEEFNVPEPAHTDIPAYIAWYLEWARHYAPLKYAPAFDKLEIFTARKASTMIYTELRVQKYFTSGELLRLHRAAIAKEMAKYPIWLTTPIYEEMAGRRPFSCDPRPPEFVKAAKDMTTISRRSAMVIPRRTKEQIANDKKPKNARSRSPGGTVQQAHSFAPKYDQGSRQESPIAPPISSRRMRPVVVLPAYSAASFTGSKEDIRRREAATNLAKTSGEGVKPVPQGKTPARKPINISLTNVVDVGTPTRPNKRLRTEEEAKTNTNYAHRSSSPMSASSDEDDEIEIDEDPIQLTVVSLPQLPMIDEAGYGVAESILVKETTLTGHDAPFLKQLIAEGKERLKDRETIGTKVVPNPIRGLLRGRDW